jgi:hypothetical protein
MPRRFSLLWWLLIVAILLILSVCVLTVRHLNPFDAPNIAPPFVTPPLNPFS